MSYKLLDHATDALVEVTAPTLKDAFIQAGNSVVDITIERNLVKENLQKKISLKGKELRYLLFDWLEEIIYQLITEGFAIHRLELDITENDEYKLDAIAFGEPIDLQKHHFKVEIKAPTFHMMEISERKEVKMRFLLDL